MQTAVLLIGIVHFIHLTEHSAECSVQLQSILKTQRKNDMISQNSKSNTVIIQLTTCRYKLLVVMFPEFNAYFLFFL